MTSLLPIEAALCERLMMTLVHFLWQGTAVGLAVLLMGWLSGRVSSHVRYGVFLGALLLMAACPPATFVLLAGDRAAGPVAAAATALQRPAMATARLPGPANQYAEPPAPPAHRRSAGAVPPVRALRVKTESPPIRPVVEPMAAPKADVPAGWKAVLLDRQKWMPYAPYVVGAYLIGVLVTLGRLALGLLGGGRLRRWSEPVDDPGLLAALGRQARALRLRTTPAIAYCRQVGVPTVVGVLRPTILLPLAIVSGMSMPQVEALLTHELAHILRYDPVWNILQRMIEALLFFHPAIWFVSGCIRSERELCCDEWVVRAGCMRLAYADSLVRAAELCVMHRSGAAAAAALAAVDRPSQLRNRVLRLLGVASDEPVRLARSWPSVLVLAVVALLVTCHHLAADTSGKYLEGDPALLKQVVEAHKANRQAIRTWKGSATIEQKTWSAANERAEPKTIDTSGGEFVVDISHDRVRWTTQQSTAERTSSVILSGADVYEVGGQSRGSRQMGVMFREQFRRGSDVLDPMSLLTHLDNQDIEAQLLQVHTRATEPASVKQKGPVGLTAAVKREAEQVVLTLSMPHETSKYVFDMTKGASLVSYDQDGPKQSRTVRVTYEQRGDAWVPASYELTSVDRLEGVAMNARGRRIVLSKQVLNEPATDAEFEPARIGLRTGDSVTDSRVGGRPIGFAYGQPFSVPKEGSTIASWVARKRSAAPAAGEASAWRTVLSGGGAVELLGLARLTKQDGQTYPEWWLPDGSPIESSIHIWGDLPDEAMAAFRITAPADALRGWVIAGGNRAPLRMAHHLAVSDMWIVAFDLPADAQDIQFELELGTNPKELFRVELTPEQLKGDARINRNGLEKIAEFKPAQQQNIATLDVLHKPNLPGDRFMILAGGRVTPVFSQVTEVAKQERQVTRMVIPARSLEGLVRQQLQWHAVTIRSAVARPQTLPAEQAAERDREKAALAAAGEPEAPATSPANEPADEPAGPPNLFFEKFPMEQAEFFSIQGSAALTVVDPKPAFCQSEQPLLHHTPGGTFPVRMLFDESGGTGGGYDTMYVDFNNNGDYLDDPVYHAEPVESPKGPDGGHVAFYFANVRVRSSGTRGWSCLLQVFLEKTGYGGGGAGLKCCFIPQYWAIGNVKVGEQTLRAALVDGNWNGTVTDPGGLALDRFPSTNSGSTVRADNMALGLDGEDRIVRGSVGSSLGTVRVFLTKYLVLDSGTYQVRALPSGEGVRLDLLPARVATGQLPLDEKARNSRFALVGKQTAVVLSKPSAVVDLPADTYYGPAFEQSLYTVHSGDVAEVPVAAPTGPAGVVLKPSGEPAAGARVMLADDSNYVYVRDGQASGWGKSIAATTDAQGQFTLAATAQDYTLVVVHDAGWAEVSKQQFESGGRVVLQAWARVEGVLLRGSKPWAGEDIHTNLVGLPTTARRLYYGYQATTDKNGRFVIDRFVPVKAELSHDATRVDVDAKPGQTVRVSLGGKGRSVVGRISGPGGERLARTGVAQDGRLVTPTRVPEPPHPEGWDKMTAEQRQAYVQAWLKSPEGQKALQAMADKPRGTWFAVKRDGSFRVENVEPGTYELDVTVLQRVPDDKAANKVVAIAHAAVEVPEGSLDTPVNVGTIEAKPRPALPTASQPAPASQAVAASQPAATRPADG